MSREQIFLGLGSNLGDRENYLAAAQQRLLAREKLSLVAASSLYETAPVGLIEQPDFLNQVIEVQSALSPEQLLDRALAVEQELGRRRRLRWGPRTIDIDLLCFGERVYSSVRLTLPHPRAQRRRFVLQPWAEIAPEFMVSPPGKTVRELLAACADRSRVQRVPRSREGSAPGDSLHSASPSFDGRAQATPNFDDISRKTGV